MTWNVEPSEFALTVKSDLAETRTKAALYALRGLIFRTPVRTGRLRGSWTVNYGNARDFSSKAFGQNRAESEGAATAYALGRGTQALARGAKNPYSTVYISTSIPYARHVNDGTRYIRGQRFVEIVFNDLRVKFG